MAKSSTISTAWTSSKGRLLLLWMGLDAVLYLGALMTLVLALTDRAARPYTYGFTIALVTSWALRMTYGIWLELRRARQAENEKARKLDEILKQHGLTDDQSASVAQAIKGLG